MLIGAFHEDVRSAIKILSKKKNRREKITNGETTQHFTTQFIKG